MKKREHQVERKAGQKPAALTAVPADTVDAGSSWERVGWLVAGVLVVALVLTLVYKKWPVADEPDAPITKVTLPPTRDTEGPVPAPSEGPHGHKPKVDPGEKGLAENFLDAFSDKDAKADKEADAAALSNQELERRFQALVEVSDNLNALKKQVAAPGALSSEQQLEQAVARRDRLLDDFNRNAVLLEKAVGQAKKARPNDVVPRWLTGELLMLVGGEPEEYAPHLKYAIAQGLDRPRLLGSMALAHLGANEFTAAYDTAADALKRHDQDRYLWQAFARIANSTNRFDEVIRRLDQAFPSGLPDWAKAHRSAAAAMQARWDVEQKLRRAEAVADNLPRVRLVIEHRQFGKGKDASGQTVTTVESARREEVLLELFEDQAPNTVANFLDLVARKFYDGTSFHLALPATIVAGGDPNTKNDDPADDGAGGPGYVIADEFKAPAARSHFRGSLSMVNTGPHTAGSQFFLSLAPSPEMNGAFTVFGRIIEGQGAADRITRGRTTRQLGHYGKIIPGDLLVRAQVVRKRNHEYRVVKGQ